MAGRPRSFDEDIVLSQIMQTFWDRGFRNTSIDDLMVVTNLSRASLYSAFGDKGGMFMKALNRYVDGPFSAPWRILRRPDGPRRRLANVISHWEHTLIDSDGRGCFVIQTYIEFAHREDEIAGRVNWLIQDLRKRVQEVIREQLPGRDAYEYVRVADYLVATLFAMHASARARSRPEHIHNLAEINRRVIAGMAEIL